MESVTLATAEVPGDKRRLAAKEEWGEGSARPLEESRDCCACRACLPRLRSIIALCRFVRGLLCRSQKKVNEV